MSSDGDQFGHDANAASGRYRCRPNLFNPELCFCLEAGAMKVTGETADYSIRYQDIVSVSVYPMAHKTLDGRWRYISRCVLRAGQKRQLIQSAHFLGWGQFEDRTAGYEAFVLRLLHAVSQANPSLVVLSGMPRGKWLGWLATAVVCVVLGIAGLFILPAGLALTIGCIAAFSGAWSMVSKGSAHPVDPATVFARRP